MNAVEKKINTPYFSKGTINTTGTLPLALGDLHIFYKSQGWFEVIKRRPTTVKVITFSSAKPGSSLCHQILTFMSNIKFRHNFQLKMKLFLLGLRNNQPLFFFSLTQQQF